MTNEEIIDNVKLELTGGVLELEITDQTLEQIVSRTLKEIQRYIDTTVFVTLPFQSCLDLSDYNPSSVQMVYNASLANNSSVSTTSSNYTDPMYAQLYLISGNGIGNTYWLNQSLTNYSSYLLLQRIRNTLYDTKLNYIFDKDSNTLYINSNVGASKVTIEYVPTLETAEDIKSDYWIDICQKLVVAHTKIILGRIRSRYKSTNALWEMDGDTLLSEGNTELTELREVLRNQSNYINFAD